MRITTFTMEQSLGAGHITNGNLVEILLDNGQKIEGSGFDSDDDFILVETVSPITGAKKNILINKDKIVPITVLQP